MRDGSEALGREPRLFGGPLSVAGSDDCPRCQFLHLGLQLAPPRVELQQDCFGRLPREPQFAPLRVPADPVCGDGCHLRREQLGARDDGHVDELARVPADEHEH